MGVTGARWCDFVVYTSKGMSTERIPFDVQFWNDLSTKLKLYYFKHFLSVAAKQKNLGHKTLAIVFNPFSPSQFISL